VLFSGDEVLELRENIPSTIKYGYYNVNIYCSTFNESARTPTHVRLGVERALRSLSSRNLACVKVDARCKVKLVSACSNTLRGARYKGIKFRVANKK